MVMRYIPSLLLAAWLLPVPVSAAPLAQTAPIAAGARLAASCAACHGTAGVTVGAPGVAALLPSLAGQERDTLLASLIAFKSGKRPATIMTQLARGYTDEQLALLATWLAAQGKGGRDAAP